jgi:hypothetical protein
MVNPDSFDNDRQHQGDYQRGLIPAHKGTNGKGNGEQQKGKCPFAQSWRVLGEIDEQGAAAAQIKEKNVQPFKIYHLRCNKMMKKTTGYSRGHH